MEADVLKKKHKYKIAFIKRTLKIQQTKYTLRLHGSLVVNCTTVDEIERKEECAHFNQVLLSFLLTAYH